MGSSAMVSFGCGDEEPFAAALNIIAYGFQLQLSLFPASGGDCNHTD
jgi:hypothetical protein